MAAPSALSRHFDDAALLYDAVRPRYLVIAQKGGEVIRDHETLALLVKKGE